ncbi:MULTISPECIES: IucA/IucC family protein [Rhizobium]|uniref:IucA/IucC family siderophore biosynthesis protein n=1 Tax=Rhizobium tropici TaxID=398 RepID=A0A6P1CDT1_RHITR|nr:MULTISPECIES: IucA/IucC family protein [Rhizobium]AGB74036.1 FhuF-like ferric iron reductase [Rhizobium tropici CIAT 899]NEV15260.1 IucA/IucC family siderophore biosynthesis protein [Rhizobium tropici]TGF00895.1 IucA/IucC family siderophore biosynthesis protein [Rhizobium sp. SEMIA 4088]
MNENIVTSRAGGSDMLDPQLHQQARHNALARLVRCLLAERILNPDALLWSEDGRQAWLPLWAARKVLHFADLQRLPANTMLNRGVIDVIDDKGRRRRLDEPADLIAESSADWSVEPASDGIARLLADIDNSMQNDALIRRHRENWIESLSRKIADDGDTGLISHLQRTHPVHQAAMLLDQWGSLEGHPFYPTWKSKPGLSAREVEALSPEFGARVNLRIAALRQDWAYVEMMSHVDSYNGWFRHNYPELWDAWVNALTEKGQTPADWLPLPIHAWHLDHFVRREFADEIAAGVLLVDGPEIATIPSMSFRTMLPDLEEARPFIKLPVAVWMTSEMRTLQAKSIHMGPRLSTLISDILAADEAIGSNLEFFREELGAILHHPETGDEHPGRFLSVVYREVAAISRKDGLLPVTVAALLAASPVDGRPLICELIARMGNDRPAAAEFFRTYAAVVLGPTIAMYLLYGIAFEAHQQNSTVLFDPSGRPQRLVIRDFGDGRSFAPLFEARGYQLKPFSRAGILPTTFNDDIALVRSFVIDACFVCHLHEVALCLNEHFGLSEAWVILRQQTEDAFDRVRSRMLSDAFWLEEREAFLNRPWPTRSVLRMHLERYRDYRVEHELPNPLTETP